MIYYRRKFRIIWNGILLLCCLTLCIALLGYFDALNSFTNDLQKEGDVVVDKASPVSTTTDFLQRLEMDMKESPVAGVKVIQSVEFLNSEHAILNIQKFGPLTQNSVNFIIVVQVHKRIKYLVHLIESLRNVDGIHDALLIFSHDINDEDINTLVRGIDFCRAIQIFYPYNIQLFPNSFPGQDPRDCPPNLKPDPTTTCKNRHSPDKYGNYRLASLTQIKHHWWWKTNYVFETIMPKYQLDRYVVLLEEDHFILPDSLTVLQKMIEMKPAICKDCQIFCLGAYLKDYKNYQTNIEKLSVAPWFTSKHNMGMAFSAETWQLFRGCSEMFCMYDDYNWDWSLLEVGLKCLRERPRVIYANSPRVIHIGDCGVHAHRCESHDAAATVRELIEQHKSAFFPEKMILAEITKRSLKASKPNGGWGDIRDHALCLLNSGWNYTVVEGNKFQRLEGNNTKGALFWWDMGREGNNPGFSK